MTRNFRGVLAMLALGLAALLGGCVAYPYDYGYGYGYNGYYGAPAYAYAPSAGYMSFSFGDGWHGDRGWHRWHDRGWWR